MSDRRPISAADLSSGVGCNATLVSAPPGHQRAELRQIHCSWSVRSGDSSAPSTASARTESRSPTTMPLLVQLSSDASARAGTCSLTRATARPLAGRHESRARASTCGAASSVPTSYPSSCQSRTVRTSATATRPPTTRRVSRLARSRGLQVLDERPLAHKRGALDGPAAPGPRIRARTRAGR